MTPEPVAEHDVDRLARFVQGDHAARPVAALDAALADEPDRGDRLAGVLTLVRAAVLHHGGPDGGDDLSGAVTLMRQQLNEDG